MPGMISSGAPRMPLRSPIPSYRKIQPWGVFDQPGLEQHGVNLRPAGREVLLGNACAAILCAVTKPSRRCPLESPVFDGERRAIRQEKLHQGGIALPASPVQRCRSVLAARFDGKTRLGSPDPFSLRVAGG